jgi:hypothetical protein
MTAHAITKALRGQWHGSYGAARCPAHDDHSPSLSITDRDGRLLVHCHAGCPQAAVWGTLKGMGLVGGDHQGGTSRYREASRPAQRRTHQRPATGHEVEARTAGARRIWGESQLAPGTPVERYLAARGITIEVPPALRYHASLKHGPTGQHVPAMVVGVTTCPSWDVTAIHRPAVPCSRCACRSPRTPETRRRRAGRSQSRGVEAVLVDRI